MLLWLFVPHGNPLGVGQWHQGMPGLYEKEDSEDGLLSFENIAGVLQEKTDHKVWGGSTLIYSTMAARAEGSADYLLGRGCESSKSGHFWKMCHIFSNIFNKKSVVLLKLIFKLFLSN